jgi:hypothetical protein
MDKTLLNDGRRELPASFKMIFHKSLFYEY